MKRIFGIPYAETTLTAAASAQSGFRTDEGLWIQRLQQRSQSSPVKSGGTEEGLAGGFWIERLQQRASRQYPRSHPKV
jgi:hypothetical protein